MPYNLIVPIAADKPEWVDTAPYMFDLHPLGNLMVFESIRALMLKEFDRIYITILRKHDERFHLKPLLERQFEVAGLSEKLRVVVLDNPTRNQPETIAKTIEKQKIKGPILIKDSDNYFECSPDPINTIGIFPLDALDRVNPSHKSYVALDDSMYVTNIIEKKIISRYFCAGAYGFEDANLFMQYFLRLTYCDNLYISHIIYAMLMNQICFRPLKVTKYSDWGTYKEWLEYCKEFKTIFISAEFIRKNGNEHLRRKIVSLYESGKTRIVLLMGNNFCAAEDAVNSIRQSGVMFHEIVRGVFSHDISVISTEDQLLKLP